MVNHVEETSVLLPDPLTTATSWRAALAGRADLIVTGNVKDFPPATPRARGTLEVQSPDDFLLMINWTSMRTA